MPVTRVSGERSWAKCSIMQPMPSSTGPVIPSVLSSSAAVSKRARSRTEELVAFLGETGDAEAFWRQAKENLLAGRIRMIFVADVIPMELLVSFLNGQMDPAQVMALEVCRGTDRARTQKSSVRRQRPYRKRDRQVSQKAAVE